MNPTQTKLLLIATAWLSLLFVQSSVADTESASQAMENPQNPLLLINSSQGDIYIELLANEAPNNVANFLALAEGEVELTDPATDTAFRPRYFNGLRFHRVIPGFIIQAASPANHPLGAPPQKLRDEINADFMGLNQQPLLNDDGSFNSMLNITSKSDFDAEILDPLYQRMDIDSEEELLARQFDVLEQLQQMSIKDVYENQGYRYSDSNPSRGVSRGVVGLANAGPDDNGPEFFISLSDADWLTGKYTIIGNVIEGMEVVDAIGELAIDPLRFSRRSAVIYSVQRLN